jgi:hypothetical protein
MTATIGSRTWLVVLPSTRDPRLHAAAVVLTIHVLGQVAFDFAVSVPQIVAAILGAALVEVVIGISRNGVIAWPASAMLTGSGVALVLRVEGTIPGEHWSFHRWWWFALIAIGSLLTKYVIRWRGQHLFNPSNIGLVVAFLVLGSGRVEPLPLHWEGSRAALLVAYAVIIGGGALITRRLGLLFMAVGCWLALGAGLGVLAASGHCIDAPWTPRPVCGGTFWWAVMASPEVCLFLFFMLTDPRTVPPTPRGRVTFGVAVGAMATLLIAPQSTEFGTKVALLAGLAIVCGSRPVLARVHAVTAPISARLSADERGAVVGAAAVLSVIAFSAATVVAGGHAREPQLAISSQSLPPVPSIGWKAPESIPAVTFAAEVLELDPSMADATARQQLLLAVLRDLAVEEFLMETGDAESLAAVDHGARLNELRAVLGAGAPDEDGGVPWPSYVVTDADLSVRRAGRQSAAVLAFALTGTMTDAGGRRPWSASIAVRQAADGRWLIVEVVDG